MYVYIQVSKYFKNKCIYTRGSHTRALALAASTRAMTRLHSATTTPLAHARLSVEREAIRCRGLRRTLVQPSLSHPMAHPKLGTPNPKL